MKRVAFPNGSLLSLVRPQIVRFDESLQCFPNFSHFCLLIRCTRVDLIFFKWFSPFLEVHTFTSKGNLIHYSQWKIGLPHHK